MGMTLVVALVIAQPVTVSARSIPDALVSLVEIGRGDVPPPRVVLTLEGGGQVTGAVTDLSASGVVVTESENVVHFVDPLAVVAITVATPSEQRNTLALPPRRLSKVDVQRRAEELGRTLTEILGAPVKLEIAWKGTAAAGLAESAEALPVIASAIEEAAAGVREAARDDVARRDLARRLKRIRVGDAQKPGAAFSTDTLAIGVAPAVGPAGRASAWEVHRALASP